MLKGELFSCYKCDNDGDFSMRYNNREWNIKNQKLFESKEIFLSIRINYR